MKYIRISIAGNGTKAELIEALADIGDQLNALTDEEIERGGDIENSMLAGEYDEQPAPDEYLELDEWMEKYKPIKTGVDSPYEGTMFETYGEQEQQVLSNVKHSPMKIWTLLEGEGKRYISAGYHFVNRLGYFITEVEAEQDNIEIKA